MPQLDKFMFITQLFWLSFFFILFYFYLLNFVLPKIFKVLRFREYKLKNFTNNNYLTYLEEYLIINSYQNLLKKNGKVTANMLVNLENRFNNWIFKSKDIVK